MFVTLTPQTASFGVTFLSLPSIFIILQKYLFQDNSIINQLLPAAESPYFQQVENGEIIRNDTIEIDRASFSLASS